MSAIGIDLGTTNCCVYVVQNEIPKLVINNMGKNTPPTPSVIGLWNEKEVYVGSTAIKMRNKYPKSIVTDVKYNMGKKLTNESIVNKEMLINTADGILKYNITRGQTQEQFVPEELSGMILKALKLWTDKYLNEDVKKAIITVPTYFNGKQREATIAAGKLGGFTEIKLLNESVAAAVAYGVEHNLSDNKIMFIFDFGGGTLDVSILKYFDNKYEVLAIDGNLHLGGNNITKLIYNHILDIINNLDAKICKRFRLRLWQLCEEAKISLTNQNEYLFDISEFKEDLQINIETFNKLTNNLFDKVLTIVERCMDSAELKTSDIDDIVLVGGSSRIPVIQERLTKFFNKEPKKNINPDEVVAQGASIAVGSRNRSTLCNVGTILDINTYN